MHGVTIKFTEATSLLLTMQEKSFSSRFNRNFYFPGAAGPGPELGHVKGKGVTQFTDLS